MYLLIIALLLSQFNCSSIANYQKIKIFRSESRAGYFVDMYLGNPPQKQIMLIDTGSNLMNVKCAQCKNCEKTTQQFYQSKQSLTSTSVFCNTTKYECLNKCSSKQTRQQCLYSLNYFNYMASSKGVIRKDIADLSSNPSEDTQFQVEFLCTTSQPTQFGVGNIMNGILGLAPSSSSNQISNWFIRKGLKIPKIIGLCLNQKDGYLQLGANSEQTDSINQKVAISRFIPQEASLITGQITQMRIGELVLFSQENRKKGVALDSGSTFNFISRQKYSQLLELTDQICYKYSDYCQKYPQPDDQLAYYLFKNLSPFEPIEDFLNRIFPILQTTINATKISTKPDIYFAKTSVSSIFVLGFHTFNEYTAEYDLILGLTWLVNKKLTLNMDEGYMEVRSEYKCLEQDTFIYQQKASFFTTISYLFLVLILILIVFIPKLIQMFGNMKAKLFSNKAQLVQQSYKEDQAQT